MKIGTLEKLSPRMRYRRDTARQRQRQREKQAPYGDPDAGLNPQSLRSHPEPKADAQPLRHPGVPTYNYFLQTFSYIFFICKKNKSFLCLLQNNFIIPISEFLISSITVFKIILIVLLICNKYARTIQPLSHPGIPVFR